MSSSTAAVTVGVFTIGGALVGVGLLLAAGAFEPFAEDVRIVVHFDESVSGLSPGSPVKLRGVPVGEVASLRVICSPDGQETAVSARCEIDAAAVQAPDGSALDLRDPTVLDRLVGEGLRASLGLEGITSSRYVALDFYDPAEHPRELPDWIDRIDDPVIPEVQSTLAQLGESLPRLVDELRGLDLAETLREFRELLRDVDAQVESLDAGAVADAMEAAAAAVRAAADDGRTIVDEVRRVAQATADLVDAVDRRTASLSESLRGTLRGVDRSTGSVADAADAVHDFFGPPSGLGEQTLRTLDDVARAGAALRRLAGFLERNPDALLGGRRQPGGSAREDRR